MCYDLVIFFSCFFKNSCLLVLEIRFLIAVKLNHTSNLARKLKQSELKPTIKLGLQKVFETASCLFLLCSMVAVSQLGRKAAQFKSNCILLQLQVSIRSYANLIKIIYATNKFPLDTYNLNQQKILLKETEADC